MFLLFVTLKDTFCHFVASKKKNTHQNTFIMCMCAAFILRWLTERKKAAINPGVTRVQWTAPSDWQRRLMHRPCHISVGCYDRAVRTQNTHKHSSCSATYIILPSAPGDLVAPATGDVITPLPYRLSLSGCQTVYTSVLVCVGPCAHVWIFHSDWGGK